MHRSAMGGVDGDYGAAVPIRCDSQNAVGHGIVSVIHSSRYGAQIDQILPDMEIGDMAGTGITYLEVEDVVARATGQGIGPLAKSYDVISSAAIDRIVSDAGDDDVVEVVSIRSLSGGPVEYQVFHIGR